MQSLNSKWAARPEKYMSKINHFQTLWVFNYFYENDRIKCIYILLKIDSLEYPNCVSSPIMNIDLYSSSKNNYNWNIFKKRLKKLNLKYCTIYRQDILR